MFKTAASAFLLLLVETERGAVMTQELIFWVLSAGFIGLAGVLAYARLTNDRFGRNHGRHERTSPVLETGPLKADDSARRRATGQV
jgi:hypothetical protein